MSNYRTPPSWWQLIKVIRELQRIVKQWDAGQITHETAMNNVAAHLREVSHV